MCVICENIITVNKVFQFDPTRTTSTRRRFVAELGRRFALLKKAAREYILEGGLFKRNSDFDFLLTMELVINAPQWRSKYDPNRIPEFLDWMEEQNNKFILSKGEAGFLHPSFTSRFDPTLRPGNEAWTNSHIRSAYQKGAQRARQELKKAGIDIPSFESTQAGLSGVFDSPFHMDRVRLAYTQTFAGLEGITKAMDATLSYTLAEGMARGDHPYQMAKAISGRIDAIGLNRAKTLARTEVIRAHHNANINELEAAGIEGVKVKAEWSTAGFNVCPICDSNEGREFTLGNIRGLIPAHPNCRCCAIPVVPRPKGRRRRRRRGRAAYKYGRKPQTVKGVAGRLPLCPVTNITANATISCISRKDITKVNRAKKAYVPATKEMQRLGEANEGVLAKIIKGKQFPDNEPFDVVIMKAGKRAHMIEVKTLIKSKVDKITMRKGSRLRKVAMAEKHPTGKVHTIVFDNRSKVSKIYHADGVGSFRLSGMEKVDKKRLQEIFGVTKGKRRGSVSGVKGGKGGGKGKSVAEPKWKNTKDIRQFENQLQANAFVSDGFFLRGDVDFALKKGFTDSVGKTLTHTVNTNKKLKQRLIKSKKDGKGLGQLSFDKADILSVPDDIYGERLLDAYYSNGRRGIFTSMGEKVKQEKLRFGKWSVGANSYPAIVRHEFGHHVWNNAMTAVERKQFTKAVKTMNVRTTSSKLSMYAGQDFIDDRVKESFAESFAAYTSPLAGTTKQKIPNTFLKLFNGWFK